MTAPTLQELFDFIRVRDYPVTFFEMLSAWPYNRSKLRTRVCILRKQGWIRRIGSDAYIVAEAYQ